MINNDCFRQLAPMINHVHSDAVKDHTAAARELLDADGVFRGSQLTYSWKQVSFAFLSLVLKIETHIIFWAHLVIKASILSLQFCAKSPNYK